MCLFKVCGHRVAPLCIPHTIWPEPRCNPPALPTAITRMALHTCCHTPTPLWHRLIHQDCKPIHKIHDHTKGSLHCVKCSNAHKTHTVIATCCARTCQIWRWCQLVVPSLVAMVTLLQWQIVVWTDVNGIGPSIRSLPRDIRSQPLCCQDLYFETNFIPDLAIWCSLPIKILAHLHRISIMKHHSIWLLHSTCANFLSQIHIISNFISNDCWLSGEFTINCGYTYMAFLCNDIRSSWFGYFDPSRLQPEPAT